MDFKRKVSLFFLCLNIPESEVDFMYNYNPFPYGKQEIIRVNGENGARAYQMAPNSNILLLDDTAPLVWLCQTDGAGYKTVTPYSITPYQPEPAPDVKSLESRIKKLEEMLNDKPDTSNVKSRKSAE